MTKHSCFSPCALSLIFQHCPNKNILKTGSIGVGCTIDEKVTVSIEKSEKNLVYFNDKKIEFPTVSAVVKKLVSFPLQIEIKSKLPLGCGFGLSGASALAAAFCINRAFNLKNSRKRILEIVHSQEIIHKTGLGTVGTLKTGGFLVKTSPGLSHEYFRLPFIGKRLNCIVIDKLETPSILKSKETIKKINKAARQAMLNINKRTKISLNEIVDISHKYCLQAGLILDKRVENTIDSIKKEGGYATMAIFGNVVITTFKDLKNIKYTVYQMKITDKKI